MSTQIRGAQIRSLFAGDGLDWVSASGTNRNYLAVQVDDSSLEISGDALQVKAGGITDAMLDGSISDGNLTEDYIQTSEVDGSTIEFAASSLNVVAAGITETELNASVAGAGLAGGGGTALSVNATNGCEVVADNVQLDLLSAGGLKLTGVEIGVEPNDFAGTGLEDDGSDNLRIAAAAAGNGLTGGGGSALSVLTASGITLSGDYVVLNPTAAGDGLDYTAGVLSVDVSDFAGTSLEDDGSENLRIAEAAAGNGLTGGGASALSVNVDGTTITIVGDAIQTNASALDHGALLGRDDDDHTLYSLADGTRAFTGVVVGIDPTADAHLATKKYVDENTTATGVIDHGGLLGLDDNDHTQYLMTGTAPLAVTSQDIALSLESTDLGVDGDNELYVIDGGIDHDSTANFVSDEHVAHSSVSISAGGLLTGGGTIDGNRTISLANSSIDHGSIGGLSDDDHTQYMLVSGTRSFTGVVGGITPTDTTHLTTKGYVDALVQGLDWQESVIIIAPVASGVETLGNRYIASETGGGWTEDYIYEWNGSSWTEIIPDEGTATWIEDEDVLKVYNGTDWVTFGSNIDHNNLSGLQGGTGGEYYHLSSSDFADLVTNQRETIEDYVGGMIFGTQTNITVTYSDNAGAHGDLNYVVDTATTSGLGVASFVSTDFDVAAGAVSLEDTVLKGITTDTGALTIAGHAVSILGGEGIDVTHTGTTITVLGEDATVSNKGIASFNTNHFSVSTGAVSIGTDAIDETLVDWGSGGDQVDATSIPIDSGGSWAGSASNVQDALEELEAGSTTLAFKTVAVSGQDDVVADAKDDTLTFVAGTDITITTNSGTDAVTIASSGSSALTASLGVERVSDDFRLDLLANGGLALTGDEVGLDSTVPGAGLTMTNGVINVIGGNGITANANDIELSSTVPGAGLTMTNGVINVIGGDGITANADEIEATVDDSTIELSASDGSGALRVKDEGITEAKLNISNNPIDGYYLKYTTASGMEWDDLESTNAVTESDIRLENESTNCNGATTAFTLDDTPVDNSLQVFLNGLIQEKGSGKDYTHSGTTVTFEIAPLTGDILLIHYTANN
jgi:hypothetical protein